MSQASCDCCEPIDGQSHCPTFAFIRLSQWVGSRTIPNDLTHINLSQFKLRFTFLSVTQETGWLPERATIAEIQSALESLTNIGAGLSVMTENGVSLSGQIPDTLWIWFSSPLTTGQDVPLLEVVPWPNSFDGDPVAISVIREGATGVDEIQAITKRPSIFELMDLAKYQNSVWQWRVVALGSSPTTPDLQSICVQQNRRDWAEWITPFSERRTSQHFSLKFSGIKFDDGPLSGVVNGGTFDLTMTVGTNAQTITLGYNADATTIELLLQSLPNAANAGAISVSGGPLPAVQVAIAFTEPMEAIALTAISNLTATPPTITTETVRQGAAGIDEWQRVRYDWPATSGIFTLTVTNVAGTIAQTTAPIPMDATAGLIAASLQTLSVVTGAVNVTSTTLSSATYSTVNQTKHEITYIGPLAATDVPQITATSSLVCKPTVIVSQIATSNFSQFRNTYEALNVGTIWKHYLRSAWGNADNRQLNIDWVHNVNPTMLARDLLVDPLTDTYYPGPLFRVDRPCGMGEWANIDSSSQFHPVQCGVRSWYLEGYPAFPESLLPIVPRRNFAHQFYEYRADFNRSNGTINVTAGSTQLELAFEIRCLGCHYDSQFSLFGTNEQSLNGYFSPISYYEGTLYDTQLGNAIENCGAPPGQARCRTWQYADDNVPQLARITFGPDGYDAHVINDAFFAPDGIEPRKPTCKTDVVSMGDGYWLEEHRSPVLGAIVPAPPPGKGCRVGCVHKPNREQVVENPTTDIIRLKMLFGGNYSHWGAWIDMEHSLVPANKIRCRFDQFDITDIKVLILGGLPCEPMGDSEARKALTNGEEGGFKTLLKTFEQSKGMYLQFITGAAPTQYGIVHKEFETDTLAPLKNWLSTGGKVLLLDGGIWPTKFLSALGCTTTMETCAEFVDVAHGATITENTLNGTLNKGSPFAHGTGIQPAWYTGNPVWGPMLTQEGRPEFAGFTPQMDSLPHPFTFDVSTFLYASRKMAPIINMGGFNVAVIENIMRPAGGLTSYTTCIPRVVPGPNAVPIGYVHGRIAVNGNVPAPNSWYQFPNGPFHTADLNYVGIAVEHWEGFFKLRFRFGGTPYETAPLPFTADAATIQAALALLPNIGSAITVLGGPLPGSVDIFFDNLALAGQNVPQLEIVDSDSIVVSTVREGGSGVDEVQRLEKGVGPSRIVISGITELVDPDAWGTDFRDPRDFGATGQNSLDEENDANFFTVSQEGDCIIHRIPEFCRSEYGWGRGLTHVVPDQFLRNLLERANEY